MKLRTMSLGAVTAIALLNVPQVATPEITYYRYVVRDATDLSYKFEFVCLGDRAAAQDVVAGLRILNHDGSLHVAGTIL